MVSIVWAGVAFSVGVLAYVLFPMMTIAAPVSIRKRVGDFYFGLAARALKQWSFTRRILSGYDIHPISVDDEQKLLKVTLSSSTLGEDNTFPFKDPDDRIKRLKNKPVALTYEQVPAAVDAELAEWGHLAAEKGMDQGFWSGDALEDPGSVKVDPYVPADDKTRLVDPKDAFHLVPNGVTPENVKTTEQLTKKRFEQYGDGGVPTGAVTGIMGFLAGFGVVFGAWYMQTEVMTSSGGGDLPSSPLGLIDPTVLADVVVMLV